MTFKIHIKEKKDSRGKGKSIINYFETKEFNASIVDYMKLGDWKCLGSELMGMKNSPILKGELEAFGNSIHPKTVVKIGKKSKNGLDDAYLQSVFSPPKDVSLIYFLDTTLGEQALKEDMRYTLDAMYKYAEAFGETRVNSFNETEKIGLVVAEFLHETARATDKNGVEVRPDPQIHAHMLWARLGIDKNGKGKKFENRKLFFNQITLGTYGRAVLSDRLRARGYSIDQHTEYEERVSKNGLERVKINSFKVVGITDEHRSFFSNRSKEIKQLEEKYGTHSSKSRDLIANTNKKAKKDFSREELIEEWKKDANSIGLTNEHLQSIKGLNNKFVLKNLKTDEELFTSIITNNKMYHKDIMSRLYEYQQYTGIKAEDIFNRWIKEDKVIKSGEFHYKSKFSLVNKDKNRKGLNLKIKSVPEKVLLVAFLPQVNFSNLIDGSISNSLLKDLTDISKKKVALKKKHK